MGDPESWPQVLARLRPLLEAVFAAYGVAPEQAQEIVEEAGLILISKRPPRQDPERWLLHRVIEQCQRRSERGD